MRYEKICKEMIEEWFDGYWKQIFWSFFSNPKVEYNLTVKSNLRPCLHNWAAIVHARLTAFLLLTHSYKLSKIGLIKIRPRLKLKCRLHPLLTPASLLGTRQKKRHSDCILKYSILEEWFDGFGSSVSHNGILKNHDNANLTKNNFCWKQFTQEPLKKFGRNWGWGHDSDKHYAKDVGAIDRVCNAFKSQAAFIS